jgi:hypothetical protein
MVDQSSFLSILSPKNRRGRVDAHGEAGNRRLDRAQALVPGLIVEDVEPAAVPPKPPALASHVLPNCDFREAARRQDIPNSLILMARPERFELPTPRFVV